MTNKNYQVRRSGLQPLSKRRQDQKASIMGIMQLFAVASIAYSTTVIIIGTSGIVPMLLVTPQALLAVIIAINKFVK